MLSLYSDAQARQPQVPSNQRHAGGHICFQLFPQCPQSRTRPQAKRQPAICNSTNWTGVGYMKLRNGVEAGKMEVVAGVPSQQCAALARASCTMRLYSQKHGPRGQHAAGEPLEIQDRMARTMHVEVLYQPPQTTVPLHRALRCGYGLLLPQDR